MRKQRATQQERIANIEKTIYVIALRFDALTKRVEDLNKSIQNKPSKNTSTEEE